MFEVLLKTQFLFLGVKLFLFWTERSDENLQVADSGSKSSNNTDEWSLELDSYHMVTQKFNTLPTIDGFASFDNAKCPAYFSKLPEAEAAGTDFFHQKLLTSEIYFICPPIVNIIRAWRKVIQTPNLTVIFCCPFWRSHTFYSEFLETDQYKPCVKDHLIFKASFVSKSDSCMFNGSTNFEMLALLIQT